VKDRRRASNVGRKVSKERRQEGRVVLKAGRKGNIEERKEG
jgi:hypothetical protein